MSEEQNVEAVEPSSRPRVRKQGLVVSDKNAKTIIVQVDRLVKHQMYKKYIRRRARFTAHDEHETARAGDRVEIVETRPLSKRKRWRLVRVVEKAK